MNTNLFQYVDTFVYKLPNDVGRTSKGNKAPNSLPKVDNVQRDKYSNQINLKDSLQMSKSQPAQVQKLTNTTWQHFMPTAARERIKR